MLAIYILWLRQLKRYVRSRARLVASLGQPTLFLFGLGFGMGPVFRKAGQGNYIQFLAPGVIAMTVLFTSVFSGIELIWDRQFGFLKETLVAPVPRILIMLGRTLGGATVALIQGFIVVCICLIAGFRPQHYGGLPLAFVYLSLIAILFTAFGTAVASLLTDFQGFQLIMNFVVMPIFFLSGAIFPLKDLPKTMDVITRCNPLTYGVDGLRGALIHLNRFSAATDLSVLAIIAKVMVAIGGWLFSRIQL